MISLGECGLGDKGVEKLLHAMSGYILRALEIPNNNLEEETAKAIASASSLTTLNLSGNRIGAEGAKVLALNSSLTTLDLGCNGIGDEGAKALALNSSLTTLDLSGNDIGAEGLALVELALDQNRHLAKHWTAGKEESTSIESAMEAFDGSGLVSPFKNSDRAAEADSQVTNAMGHEKKWLWMFFEMFDVLKQQYCMQF